MGLYDRDYYREDRPGIRLAAAANWSAVATLIAINVAVEVVGFFLPTNPITGNWITQHLGLQPDLFQHPWDFYQLLTYGFVHDPSSIFHLLFNMIGLFVFGAEVETVYGKREFYKLYLSLIILSGLFYAVITSATHSEHPVVGASGAIMGVAVIFACHFPRRTLILFPIPIPVPAAVFVGAYILIDLLGTQSHESTVAHWAHLGGAAFGFLYYRTGWSLFRLWPRGWSTGSFSLPRRGPKLRVHSEPDEVEAPPDDYLTTGRIQQRVDQLLEKISTSGESSLTAEERQFLADASRRYQQQRRR
ncbi:MAG TPA: rhomboid family intramembrane serine protease [Pirellulales bacterium]|nr:rhomboid family intramembrane serine protease [Pirellulales bacterium]